MYLWHASAVLLKSGVEVWERVCECVCVCVCVCMCVYVGGGSPACDACPPLMGDVFALLCEQHVIISQADHFQPVWDVIGSN